MAIGDLPLLAALKGKMRFDQARQKVLAQNVANADTPGYSPRDLKAVDFSKDLGRTTHSSVTMSATRPGHFSLSMGGNDGFEAQKTQGFETTPSGNGVTLEDEMMKVTSNQMDYRAVTALYTRSLQLIKTAIGRSA